MSTTKRTFYSRILLNIDETFNKLFPSHISRYAKPQSIYEIEVSETDDIFVIENIRKLSETELEVKIWRIKQLGEKYYYINANTFDFYKDPYQSIIEGNMTINIKSNSNASICVKYSENEGELELGKQSFGSFTLLNKYNTDNYKHMYNDESREYYSEFYYDVGEKYPHPINTLKIEVDFTSYYAVRIESKSNECYIKTIR